ncbi:MAG: family 78 glycoside hydrolase catalytic domain [Opitutae bacterium]|nr:family 78 glycoside hydrolase catalytic domain [Opitutae bacterium]
MRATRLIRFLGLVLLPCALAQAIAVDHLRTEYQTQPLALDRPHPRFSWELHADERAQRQTAYQIRVATSPETLTANEVDVWDSGRVTVADNFGVPYGGPELRAGARYYWSVRVWDARNQPSAWSTPSWWQMGPLKPTDWHARWIGAAPDAPSPLLRRAFQLEKKIVRATAYAYAIGWYRLLVNGTELTERVLSPVNSNYPKGLFYDAYDVTALVRRGGNAIGMWMAPGYAQSYSKYGYRWDTPPAAFAQLQIAFDDGTTQTIATDEAWKWTASPVVASDIYHGETYDARREIAGWSESRFDDQDWKPVALRAAPPGPLIACPFPGLAVAAEYRPVKMTESKPGVFVFDLGQNIAGWVRLRTRGPAGARVVLRHAEELHADGTLDVKTNRAAQATDTYILRGDRDESYEPRFTYHGFRYVEVTGYTGTPTLDSLTGCAIRAAVPEAGSFSCSDPLLNRMHANFRWTIANNLMGIPTDTATRDERTPCQMDSLTVEDAAICNFALAPYYAKWLHDIAGDGGSLPNWTGDQVVLPFLLWENYGDRRLLAEHYDNMRQVVDRFAATAEAAKHWAAAFGDWAAPNPSGSYEGSFSEGELVNRALFYRTARIVADAAALLGRAPDAERYAQLAERVRTEFDARFYDPRTATYGLGRQVTSVLPLAFDMVPSARRSAVVAALRQRIEEVDRGHLDTGIFGTRYLFEVLFDHGLADLALRVLTATGYPGYADQIAQGATTTWEQWSFDGSMQTHNHAMFAGPDATLFSRLGGIQPGVPGFREIVFCPAFPTALSSVDCSRATVMGIVGSRWRREAGRIVLAIDVPANATARLYLPAQTLDAICEGDRSALHADGVLSAHLEGNHAVLALGSGRYEFSLPDRFSSSASVASPTRATTVRGATAARDPDEASQAHLLDW